MNVSDRLKEINSMSVSEFDNLKEGGDRIDEFWNPNEDTIGNEFKGMFMGKRQFQGADGPFETILIKDVGGKTWGLPDAKILHDAVAELNIGDAIYIKYLGKADPVKGTRKYHDFEVKGHKFTEPIKTNNNQQKGNNPTLQGADDPEALTQIESYVEIYKSENHNQMPDAGAILNLTNSDPDLDKNAKLRVMKQLAELVKKGDIKE